MGQRIRALRKGAELSQTTLAEELGIDQSTLSDIERGLNEAFPGKVLLKMSERFNTSPYYIVYGVSDAEGRAMSIEEAELLLAFRRASGDQQRALLLMARALSPERSQPQQ